MQEIPLDRIETGGNVRELDAEHIAALAASMRVRGLIVPVNVHSLDGDRFTSDAGEHCLAVKPGVIGKGRVTSLARNRARTSWGARGRGGTCTPWEREPSDSGAWGA